MLSLVRAVGLLGGTGCRALRTSCPSPSYHIHLSNAQNALHAIKHTLRPKLSNRSSLHQQSHRSASTLQLSQPAPPHFLGDDPPATAITSTPPSHTATAHSSADSHIASSPQPSFWVSFLTLLSIFPILFAVDDAVVTIAEVRGRSMQPTFNPHLAHSSSSSSSSSSTRDRVLVWKLSSQSPSSLPAGSVLVLQSPHNPHRRLIKRLVGRENDWITTQRRVSDTERMEASAGEYSRIEVISVGRVWVEGDNEAASVEDSREYGQMPAALVQGRAVAVVWPPSRVGWIENTLQYVGGDKRIRNMHTRLL